MVLWVWGISAAVFGPMTLWSLRGQTVGKILMNLQMIAFKKEG
jgi:hypothetical protein